MDTQKSFKERRSYGTLLSIKICVAIMTKTVVFTLNETSLHLFVDVTFPIHKKDPGVRVRVSLPVLKSDHLESGSQGNYVLGFYPSLPQTQPGSF